MSNMIFLNVGNLWSYSYLDRVISLNKDHKHDGIMVKSLFGSVPLMTPTARSTDRLPVVDVHTVEKYIDKAQSEGINIRYTLNQSCIGSMQNFKSDWDDHLKSNVKRLHDMGVHEWTVTSALLIELLRDMFPSDFIEVSTIAEVATPSDARRWKNIGADGVNVSTSVNRDFKTLMLINRELYASVLVNEACLYRCPYRRDCYNLSSHDSLRGSDYFNWYPFRRCNEWRIKHPVEWLKSRMVAPQWLQIYNRETGIKWFKIAYRTHPESVAIPILEKYMSQYFGGNWCELWPTIAQLGHTEEPTKTTNISLEVMDDLGFIQEWIEKGDHCSEARCGTQCTFCYRVYEEAVRH